MDTPFVIEEIIEPDFTGQIILHCNGGRVLQYEKRSKHSVPPSGPRAEISEIADLTARRAAGHSSA